MDRRHFLIGTGAAVGILALEQLGCVRPSGPEPVESAPRSGFPLLVVSGSPFEIGRAIGQRFSGYIREGLKRRQAWFERLRSFVEEDPGLRYDPFLDASQRHFPEVVDELRGWAEGSGVGFRELMILNLYPELSALMAAKSGVPGCSTLAFSRGGRLLLCHNEDGDSSCADLMFLVKATPTGKPTFLCLTYPSNISGNGPAMNSAGIVATTNFISGREVWPGVPRYFISRAILGASSLEEAVSIATHPQRAYSFHSCLGSRHEQRLLSVEVSAHRQQVREVNGLFVHTNHLVLSDMKDVPQDEAYVGTSSVTRYDVLAAEAAKLDPESVSGNTLVNMLSSHQGSPYSPCRHPTGLIRGATLACSLFDLTNGSWRLFHGNPCKNESCALALS